MTTIFTEEGIIGVDAKGVTRLMLKTPVECGTCKTMRCFFIKPRIGPSQCVNCTAEAETNAALGSR